MSSERKMSLNVSKTKKRNRVEAKEEIEDFPEDLQVPEGA